LDWDLNTGYCTGRWDRDINAARTLHSTTTEKTKQNRSSTLSNKYRKTTEVKTAAEKERRGRHHHTERATAVQGPTPRCCCTRKATGRHAETPSQKQLSRARGPPTRHSARLTLSCAGTAQTRRTAPHSRLISKIAIEVAQRGASPSEPNPAADHHRVSNHLAASPRASRCHRARSPKMSPAPSPDVVPHRGNSAVLNSPTAIRCRPSLLWLQMPQASSVDAVPHRTGECQATPATAERCKQTSQQPRRDPQTPTESRRRGLR
jgi:hypothetical protein